MKEKKIMALADKNIMNTYRRIPIVLVKGEGARLMTALASTLASTANSRIRLKVVDTGTPVPVANSI